MKAEPSVGATSAAATSPQPRGPAVPGDYFEWVRDDVLAVVPLSARRVLSVGCGSGATEAQLVGRGVEVVAIERDPRAAAVARSRGITVLEGDASGFSDPDVQGRGGPAPFDCLIYADVLEHLPEPEALLASHVRSLADSGTVVISVPNFRHYSVLWRLFVRGCVGYEDAGIFDRTHLRITTRKLVAQWLAVAHLGVRSVVYRMPQRRERYLSAATFGLLREFLARQVILVGTKAGGPPVEATA